MEDYKLVQQIEQYLNGSMTASELADFEWLRKNNADVDQMVVEHSMFLQTIDAYSQRTNLKHNLNLAYARLSDNQEISTNNLPNTKTKVINFFHRYKKVTAIAACVGGAIALFTSALVSYYFNPLSGVKEINRKISDIENKQNQIQKSILTHKGESKLPEKQKYISGGTGFLIDAKGYLVTNAHVLKGEGAIVVDNSGKEYKTNIIKVDANKDIAILKIADEDFVATKTLPYGIRSSISNLGEEIFTLGFPRNEMVYNQGYLSAKTGYNGDSATYQIQLNANPGNSGGPIFDKEGYVIGILSAKQAQADGVSFAIKSKTLVNFISETKKQDTVFNKIKLSNASLVENKSRESQVKKLQDCVFFVKAYGN